MCVNVSWVECNAIYTFLMDWQVQQDACRGEEETQTEEK